MECDRFDSTKVRAEKKTTICREGKIGSDNQTSFHVCSSFPELLLKLMAKTVLHLTGIQMFHKSRNITNILHCQINKKYVACTKECY